LANLAPVQPQQAQQRVQQQAPKPLTREQYQQRWHQQQKQKQLAQSQNPSFNNDSLKKYASPNKGNNNARPAQTLPKPTYAAFKQTNQKAVLNTLPQAVKTKLNASN